MALGTKGLFARGIGITGAVTVGLFSRGILGLGVVTPRTGQTVQPFTVQTARQLFKKVAWEAEAKHTTPTDGRATRYDLAQPTVAEQRQRLDATQRARAQTKQTRERMLWIASILPQLEDGE